uniref:Uncharacterized protein n=1 Tax=Arundo donax TaxID=35708 RepID=A0A0A9B7P0_ARUDO
MRMMKRLFDLPVIGFRESATLAALLVKFVVTMVGNETCVLAP